MSAWPRTPHPASPGLTLATPSCPLRALPLKNALWPGRQAYGLPVPVCGSLSVNGVHRQACSVHTAKPRASGSFLAAVMSVFGNVQLSACPPT